MIGVAEPQILAHPIHAIRGIPFTPRIPRLLS
jgi:hypothetical protein